MNIEAKKFTLEMSHDELWYTAFDIKSAIEHTLKNHWVNHQESWQRHEKERLFRCKTMFLALGRPELFDEIFLKAKEIFDQFNKSTAA